MSQQHPSSAECETQGTTGYFDLQVNGYGGVDFNADDLSAEALHKACELIEADGTTGFLPTIITDTVPQMSSRLARLVELREQDALAQKLIAGIHIEGPFISPEDGYRGAHPLDAVQPANADVMKQLLEAAGGLTRIVTLAPEYDADTQVIRMLTDRGVTVSAGHCNPSLEQLDAAIDAGLAMFTHLGNGCPMNMHRHDNIIQRVLGRAEDLWLCFIADGVHVPPPALTNYIKLAGDRAVIVSDAMAAAGLGPGRHRLGRWEIEVGEDLVAWGPNRDHLVGAAMSMKQMDDLLADRFGLSPEFRTELTAKRPRQVIQSA